MLKNHQDLNHNTIYYSEVSNQPMFSDKMEEHNRTVLSEFILMGITDRPELQAPLFGLFLIIYVISVVGNLGMVILTKVDSRLQTPMYFFLRHLALTDLGYSTAVGPKMLVNFAVDQNKISYYLCATQMGFFIMFIINVGEISSFSHHLTSTPNCG